MVFLIISVSKVCLFKVYYYYYCSSSNFSWEEMITCVQILTMYVKFVEHNLKISLHRHVCHY
jgi:hypothetical protein